MGCNCNSDLNHQEQQGALTVLLIINALMFVVEFIAGWMADSTALIADSMDMLADALVYSVGLYAVGKSMQTKIHVARLSGLFQILIGLGVAVDVMRRFVAGSEPESMFMIMVGFLAGVLVMILGTSLPDLIIGLMVSVLVILGGISILRDAKYVPGKQSKT